MVLDETKMIWYGTALPGRKAGGTYSIYSYTSLPPCPKKHRFSHLRTHKDLAAELKRGLLKITSVTACYFDLNEQTGVFYRDQQDCIIWALDKNGVYCRENDMNKMYVAKDLGEFLWRINIENACWYEDIGFKRETGASSKECEEYIKHYGQQHNFGDYI